MEKKREKTDENSGHYVIPSSFTPERRRLNDDRWNAARLCQKQTSDHFSDSCAEGQRFIAAIRRSVATLCNIVQCLLRTDKQFIFFLTQS